jgi:hypothetical protein
MATRLKTVQWALPSFIGAVTDNTLTAMATMTMYCPEFSGTVTWKSCVLRGWMKERATMTTGNYTTRELAVNIGGAGNDLYTSGGTYTGSGENNCVFHSADVTASFTADWTSGTSKTIVVSMRVDFTATTLAPGDIEAILYCTYEYDDAQGTQIKTVLLPLDAPTGALATSKGSAIDTIPALDSELPESSKTYRNIAIVIQGNCVQAASTTDTAVSMQVDTYTAYTSSTLEHGSSSDYWCAFVYNIFYRNGTPADAGIGMDTSIAHSFYLWATTATHHHPQIYMLITYEFDATASTGVYVSLQVPMELPSPMGGATSAEQQRAWREVWIEEPGTITTKRIAFYPYWEQLGAITGINMRVGTDSFVSYTDAAAALCGSNGAMCRNDSAFTLARGRNTLTFDIYRTDTTDLGWNLSGFWLICYTSSSKPSGGYGAANHTVQINLGLDFTTTGAAAAFKQTSAVAPSIPEGSYFLNAVGSHLEYLTNTTGNVSGVNVLFEKVSGEEGPAWLSAYTDLNNTDPETGLRSCWSQIRSDFMRWPNDADTNRLDIEQARRWQVNAGSASSTTVVVCFWHLDLMFTYHTITKSVSGEITGSGGGTIYLYLHRANDNPSKAGEKLLETSRSGDGLYSFTWYDDTENVYTSAYEDSSHSGRSDKSTAT